MIVDPDFFDHWRTGMLGDMLGGDRLAPLYLLRLWAHCEVRHAIRFPLPAIGLRALCRATVAAEVLEAALIEGGFIARHDQDIEVLCVQELNAKSYRTWVSTRRQLDVPAATWDYLRAAVFDRDGWCCTYCGQKQEEPECDHILPLSRGGRSVMENLTTACVPCNRSKGAKTPQEWRSH